MVHETLNTNVKGYVDELQVFKDNVFIRGWSFHESKGILPLRAKYNNSVVNCEVQMRKDVASFYKNDNIILCGWKFKVPKTKFAELQIEIDNEWVTIFTFSPSSIQEQNVTFVNDVEETVKTLSNTSITTPTPSSDIPSNTVTLSGDNIKDGAIPDEIMREIIKQLPPNAKATICDVRLAAKKVPTFLTVDNFYENPDSVRSFGLQQNFQTYADYHKSKRTDKGFRFPGLKGRFEEILGAKIKSWEEHSTNGCFESCVAGDQLVYHCDLQQYAGIIFLTPDAPPESGTSFYRSKYTKKMKVEPSEHDIVFRNGFLDSTEFDVVDTVGNVYNRLVLFDAQLIHAASTHFGKSLTDGGLFQLFFFDIEK